MKVAIAVDGKSVSQHFGHCEGFNFYEVENSEVKNSHFVPNPGHRPGFLPKYLAEKGINVIITGGMGNTAQVLFKQNGIEVITGATGEADLAMNSYLSGNLESTDEVCERHEHHGECGE
ncbi:NifB/NifX family molybdenum-iron cluster-binding protein [Caldisalinibacter kiritimatiensis]|uniref:ATPases involved in chromosome partitioning n=1 Tax=Caldisalinibacter kiritimatiensis TaxID=1304284 RepID=R1CXL5_9FIRM|nr:NifB/NifX family molybdenum-iron cluster-binding protein [Caldisalinibacter kiritimatiensis]EOD01354.1 ATPases involved in chromosome partitioning [Caldisalinibacter kiritimatiensis]